MNEAEDEGAPLQFSVDFNQRRTQQQQQKKPASAAAGGSVFGFRARGGGDMDNGMGDDEDEDDEVAPSKPAAWGGAVFGLSAGGDDDDNNEEEEEEADEEDEDDEGADQEGDEGEDEIADDDGDEEDDQYEPDEEDEEDEPSIPPISIAPAASSRRGGVAPLQAKPPAAAAAARGGRSVPAARGGIAAFTAASAPSTARSASTVAVAAPIPRAISPMPRRVSRPRLVSSTRRLPTGARPRFTEDDMWVFVPVDDVTIGTIQTMCSRAESDEREGSSALSVFEMVSGTEDDSVPRVDYNKAVRRFKRPSVNLQRGETFTADEIRPPPVLHRVMEYLCLEIMDRTDHPFHDVYAFVRDRTRAIRQEISIQKVFNPVGVYMSEKIVRFYIVAGHRLAEQDRATFDAFQNQEQIDKTLVSLKDMYSDLYKKGVLCPNEAEMRAYYVLLDLSSPTPPYYDVRPDIYSTPEMQFAIKVWEAVKADDWYRFFKAVREATYLQSCVLHLYFNSIRQRALQIMNRAFKGPYPIADLTKALAFEDDAEAEEVCRFYGLIDVMENTTAVVFGKRNLVVPREARPPIRTSWRLIEPKAAGRKISEIVEGPKFTGEKPGEVADVVFEEEPIEETDAETIDIEEHVPKVIAMGASLRNSQEGLRIARSFSPFKSVVAPFITAEPEEDTEADTEAEAEPLARRASEVFTETEDEDEREHKLEMVRSALIEGLPVPSISGASPVPTVYVAERGSASRRRESSKLDFTGFGLSSSTLQLPGMAIKGAKLPPVPPHPTPWGSLQDLRSASPRKDQQQQQRQQAAAGGALPSITVAPDREEPEEAGGLFGGFGVPLMVTNVSVKSKAREQEEQAAAARLEEEQRLTRQRAKEAEEQREGELRRKLLQDRRQREEEGLNRQAREQAEAEAERRERERAEAARRQEERERREREERLRRQRQEEWEAKVEHLKREIKKGQIHWLWDRWRKAYLEKKEQQRKTEEERQRKLKLKQKIEGLLSAASAPPSAAARLKRAGLSLGGSHRSSVTLGASSISLLSSYQIEKRSNQLHDYLRKAREEAHVQIEGYWASLDLPRLVYSPLAHSHLKQQPPNSQAAKDIYWKLVVAAESLPSAQRVAAESSSPALWLTAKLTRAGLPLTPQKPGVQTLSLYTVDGVQTDVDNDEAPGGRHVKPRLHVCVTLVDDSALKTPAIREECTGSRGFVFMLPPMAGPDASSYWAGQRARLTSFVAALPPHGRSPLLVLTTDPDSKETVDQIEQNLRLSQLPAHLVGHHAVVSLRPAGAYHHYSSDQLARGLGWLAAKAPRQPLLLSFPLKDVLEVQANRHLSALFAYYYRLSQQQQQHVGPRGQDEALLRPDVNSPAFPQAVTFIQQWNDLVTYTAQELTNDQIQEVSWPPQQFAGQRDTVADDTTPPAGFALPPQRLGARETPLPPFGWNSAESVKALRARVLALAIRDSDGHVLMEEIAQAIAAHRAQTGGAADDDQEQEGMTVDHATTTNDDTRDRRALALAQLKRSVVLALWKFLDRVCQAQQDGLRADDHHQQQQRKQRVYLLAKQVEEVVSTHLNQRAGDDEGGFMPLPWHRIFQLVFDFLVAEHIEPAAAAAAPPLLGDIDDIAEPKATPDVDIATRVLLLPSSPLLATLPSQPATTAATTDASFASPAAVSSSSQGFRHRRPLGLPPTPLVLDDRRSSIETGRQTVSAAAAQQQPVAKLRLDDDNAAEVRLPAAAAAASEEAREDEELEQEQEEVPGREKAKPRAPVDRRALGLVDWSFLVAEALDREETGENAVSRGVKRRAPDNERTDTTTTFERSFVIDDLGRTEEKKVKVRSTPVRKRRYVVEEDLEDGSGQGKLLDSSSDSLMSSRGLTIDSLLADLAAEGDEERRLKQLLGGVDSL